MFSGPEAAEGGCVVSREEAGHHHPPPAGEHGCGGGSRGNCLQVGPSVRWDQDGAM